jgi:predicted ATPase
MDDSTGDGSSEGHDGDDKPRLNWTSAQEQLVGRESEWKRLHRALEEAVSGSARMRSNSHSETLPRRSCALKSPPIVFEGESGMGKTFLVTQFLVHVQEEHKDVLAGYGAFPFGRSDVPFAPFQSAMHDILSVLLREDREIWKTRFTEQLPIELNILRILFQDLDDLYRADPYKPFLKRKNSSRSTSMEEGLKWGFERFRLALRSLLRLIALHRPVVMILDDLQEAEIDAWSILTSLVHDPSLPGLLLVGTMIPKSLKIMNACSAVEMHTLAPWRENETHTWLEALVQKASKEDLQALVKFVSGKAYGCPLSTIRLLRHLEYHDCFSYDTERRWTIQLPTYMGSGSTIFESVCRLPNAMMALTTAACLQTNIIDPDTLFYLLTAEEDEGDAYTSNSQIGVTHPMKCIGDLYAVLNYAVDAGLLIRRAQDSVTPLPSRGNSPPPRTLVIYRFANSSTRQAAYKLVQTPDEWHLRIGRHLRDWMHQVAERGSRIEDSLHIQVVRQLTLGQPGILDSWELLDLSELNYQVAQRTAHKASFYASLSFLKDGMRLLGNDPWKHHFDLALEFSIAIARMYSACGRYQDAILSADQVIFRTNSIRHQRVAHMIKMSHIFFHEGRSTDAIDYTLDVLESLECPFPRRFHKVHIATNLLKVRKMLKSRADVELRNLPTATDPKVEYTADFLEKLGEYAYNARSPQPDCLTLVLLRHMLLTLDYGVLTQTAASFVVVGFIFCQIGEFDEGAKYAAIGLEYAARGNGGRSDQRAIVLYHFFVAHWSSLYYHSIEPTTRAVLAMWEMGSVQTAIEDTIALLRLKYTAGQDLTKVSAAIANQDANLRDYQLVHLLDVNMSFFQMVSNFMGKSESPSVLSGEYMDQDKMVTKWTQQGNENALQALYFHQMELAYYFGDIKLAKKMLKMMWSPYTQGADIWVTVKVFYKGMVYVSLYASTGQKKYKVRGNAAIRQMKAWVEKGVVNCQHMLLLLRAEELTGPLSGCENDFDFTRRAFDDAISCARKHRFLQHQALGNELAAIHCIRQNEDSWAAAYLDSARKLYGEWGAAAKVEQMDHKYRRVFEGSTEVLDSDMNAFTSSFHSQRLHRNLRILP